MDALKGDALKRQLLAEGSRFELHQAVRLLERWARLDGDRAEAAGRGPRRDVPVGRGPDPEREAVRFSARPGLGFPATEVQAIHAGDPRAGGGPPFTVSVGVFGLAGALGPLPLPFTELLLERNARQDSACQDFIDLFHHRLLALLVRLVRSARPSLALDDPAESTAALGAFAVMGAGTPHLRRRLGVPARQLLGYAGLLASRPRSLAALLAGLEHWFGVPARGRDFAGGWLRLEPGQWTLLGRRGPSQELGRGAVLGTRVWDPQARIEVRLGPLGLSLFLDLLPGLGPGWQALRTLVRLGVDEELEVDVRPVLCRHEVPLCRLGGGSRLGWTSWLGKDRPLPADDGQVRIDPRRPL